MKTIHTVVSFFRHLSLTELIAVIYLFAFFTEWLTGKMHKRPLYSFYDSINNFILGIISFSSDILFSLATFPIWIWLYENASIFNLHDSTGTFLLLFILIDFAEYWFHRISHEVNVFWLAHQIHHQSEHFNLTVGLRTSLFVPLLNLWFYLLFPVLGFSPLQMVVIILIQGVYQLLIHTQVVGKLGWIEYILVTPSAHRVHHGKNNLYIDRNYGKCFIVWDRLFGTYCRETEPVQYGVTTPPASSRVTHILFYPYRHLFQQLYKDRSLQNFSKLLFRRPSADLYQKNDSPFPNEK